MRQRRNRATPQLLERLTLDMQLRAMVIRSPDKCSSQLPCLARSHKSYHHSKDNQLSNQTPTARRTRSKSPKSETASSS